MNALPLSLGKQFSNLQRLLLDNNLSVRLVELLSAAGPGRTGTDARTAA